MWLTISVCCRCMIRPVCPSVGGGRSRRRVAGLRMIVNNHEFMVTVTQTECREPRTYWVDMTRTVTMAVVREVVSTGEAHHREPMCENSALASNVEGRGRPLTEWPN